eukprot:UN14829
MSLWRNYDNFKTTEQDWLALLDGFRPSSLTLNQCRDAVRKYRTHPFERIYCKGTFGTTVQILIVLLMVAENNF